MPLTDVTIKYLEMNAPGELRPKRARHVGRDGRASAAAHAGAESVPFYATVGRDYSWIDRLSFSAIGKMARIRLAEPDIDTYVLDGRRNPRRLLRTCSCHDNGDIEIKYFSG